MFKPFLAPNNKINLETIPYPQMASYKFDGIRCIFKDGQMYTRSLKQVPNIKLHERFSLLKKYSVDNDVILDGELWCRSVPFNELSGIVRQFDCKLPDDLFFYCFDYIKNEKYEEEFITRVTRYMDLHIHDFIWIRAVDQWEIDNADATESLFNRALDEGFEGLILRNPKGYYKTGRATVKENLMYKVKPFETFDAMVTGVIQATEVNEGAEKKTNELGRSVTSKKQGDRHLIEKASAFEVEYNGKSLKVTLAMTDEEKEAVWKTWTNYIGKTIEYKGMLVGAKDLPRHPVFLRFIDTEVK